MIEQSPEDLKSLPSSNTTTERPPTTMPARRMPQLRLPLKKLLGLIDPLLESLVKAGYRHVTDIPGGSDPTGAPGQGYHWRRFNRVWEKRQALRCLSYKSYGRNRRAFSHVCLLLHGNLRTRYWSSLKHWVPHCHHGC